MGKYLDPVLELVSTYETFEPRLRFLYVLDYQSARLIVALELSSYFLTIFNRMSKDL